MVTFAGLLGVAQVLFWTAWWVAYRILPEGALRGRTGAAALPLEHLEPVPRALAVLAWNALTAGAFVAGANLWRVRRLPLGFVPAVTYWILYGLMLGSNSFALPLTERPAPSLAVLLGRSGILELTAYLLVAAATADRARWLQEGWWGGRVRRLEPRPLGAVHRGMVLLAAVLLVAGAVREVAQWCAAAGGCR
jgi:hypothetical protein